MKQVSIYVCVVLLIVSVFSTWKTTPQSDVRAGKGDGVNETIESPDDFQSLISSLSGGSILTASTGDGGVTVLSGDKTYIGFWDDDDDDDHDDDYDYDDDEDDDYDYDDDDDDDDDDDRREKTYNSMTIREEVYMSSSQYFHLSFDLGNTTCWRTTDQDSTLNRSMTLYITKNERYYHSVGQIFSDAYAGSYDGDKTESGGSQAYIDFDVEVYINYRKDKYLLRINKWVMLGNETVVVSDDLIGKWASLHDADDASDVVGQIDGLNEEAFEALRTVLAEAIGQDSLHGSGGTYTLDKTEESEDAGKTDMKLSLDLADPERPVVSMYVGYDYNEIDSGDTSQASTYMEVTYTFENINNTVIEIDDDIDVLKLTSKNINRYIYQAE